MAGVTVRPPTVEEHQAGGTDHLHAAGHPAGQAVKRIATDIAKPPPVRSSGSYNSYKKVTVKPKGNTGKKGRAVQQPTVERVTAPPLALDLKPKGNTGNSITQLQKTTKKLYASGNANA